MAALSYQNGRYAHGGQGSQSRASSGSRGSMFSAPTAAQSGAGSAPGPALSSAEPGLRKDDRLGRSPMPAENMLRQRTLRAARAPATVGKRSQRRLPASSRSWAGRRKPARSVFPRRRAVRGAACFRPRHRRKAGPGPRRVLRFLARNPAYERTIASGGRRCQPKICCVSEPCERRERRRQSENARSDDCRPAHGAGRIAEHQRGERFPAPSSGSRGQHVFGPDIGAKQGRVRAGSCAF